MTEQQFKMVF